MLKYKNTKIQKYFNLKKGKKKKEKHKNWKTQNSIWHKLCFLPPLDAPNHCYYGKSENYQGTVSETVNGTRCQRWDAQSPTPHAAGVVASEFMDNKLPDNHCRTLLHTDYPQPWCFTTDPNNRWGFCNVSKCEREFSNVTKCQSPL